MEKLTEQKVDAETLAAMNLADINLFLSKIQKNPDHYADEVAFLVKTFLSEFQKVKSRPGEKNEQFYLLLDFFSHVFEFYTADLSFLAESYQDLLRNFSEQLDKDLRFKLVHSLTLLARKGHWHELTAIKFFLDMLAVKDKAVRALIFKSVLQLVSKIDLKGRKSTVHKELLDHFSQKTRDPDDAYSKNIFKLLITLMKKNIWKDAKVANLLAEGTYHDDASVVSLCCRFFIENVDHDELDLSSDEEEERRNTFKAGKNAKYGLIHKKKSNTELNRVERIKKKVRKMQNSDRHKENDNFLLIELVYNPLSLCEKIFAKLKSSKLPFKVKLLMMGVLSRLIWRFELIFPNYFLFIHRYIKNNNNELPQVLACLAGACHARTPISELRPIVQIILLNFANEAAPNDKLAMGVNALKEISLRCPECLEEDEIYQVCLLRKLKHKAVAGSVRSFINLWRSINVKMLKKEFRGRFFDEDENLAWETSQASAPATFYASMSLYNSALGTKGIECERILTDADFKKIKRLKKRLEEEKAEKDRNENLGDFALHRPSFNFEEERRRLKSLEKTIQQKFDRKSTRDPSSRGAPEEEEEEEVMDLEAAEEGDDEMLEFGEEEMEELDEEELEGLEEGEDDIEDEEEEGDFEGEEEDLEAGESDGMEEEELQAPKPAKQRQAAGPARQLRNELEAEASNNSDEVNSSFFDESESSEQPADPRSSFLSASAIYDKDKIRRKLTRDDIKKQKERNRDEQKQKKVGHKLKNRGRLTNQQKRKNNPYQMFIQKKRLQNRLIDLKKAQKKIAKKQQKGHCRARLGKSKNKKIV